MTKLTSSTSKVSDDVIINENSSPVITSDDDFETTTTNLSGEIFMSLASLKQVCSLKKTYIIIEYELYALHSNYLFSFCK